MLLPERYKIYYDMIQLVAFPNGLSELTIRVRNK